MVGPGDAEQQRKLEAGRRMLDKFRKDKGAARPSPFVKPRAASQHHSALTAGTGTGAGGEGSSTAAEAGGGIQGKDYPGYIEKEMRASQSLGGVPASEGASSTIEASEAQKGQMPCGAAVPDLGQVEENIAAPNPGSKVGQLAAAQKDSKVQPVEPDGDSGTTLPSVPVQEDPPVVQDMSISGQGRATEEEEEEEEEKEEQVAVSEAAVLDPIPEPLNRVDAPAAPDAAPYVADGVIYTSYGSHTQRSSRTTYSIRREAGMRVDAMMGEADGEGEKDIVIASLRAMVDGFKHQMASDQDELQTCKMSEELAKEQAKNLYLELERAQEEGRELASKLRARIADLERSQAQQSSFDPKQGAAPLLAAHVTDADAQHTVKALQERNQGLESENAQVREKLVQADVAAKEMEFSLMALNAKLAEEGPLRAELEHQVLMLRRQPQSELEEEVLRLRKEAEKGGMEAERAREESAELAVKLRKRIAALEESGLEEKVSNLTQDLERAQGEVMRLRKMLEETQGDAAEVEKRLKAQVEFLEGRLRSSEASGASVKEDLEEEIKALKSALEGAPPSSLRFEGAQEMERRLEEAQEGQESMKKELERVQEDLAGAREGLETVRAAAMMKLDQLCEEVSRSDEALQASREEARKMGEDVMRLEEEVRGARAMASTGVEDETERLREEVMRLEESVRGARAEASRGEEEARSARDLLFKAQEGRDEKVAEMLQLRSELSASTAECERLKDLASSFEAGREEEIEAATRRQESLEVEILAMQEVVKGAREDASRWEVEAGRAMAVAELKDEEMRLLREELSLEAAHRRSSEDDQADLHGEEELERVKALLDAEVIRREEAQAALDAARGELEKAQFESREAQKRAEEAQGDAEKARGDAGRAQERAEDAEKALYEAGDELERRSGQLEMLKKSAAMAEEMQDKLKGAVTEEVGNLRGRIQELEEEAQKSVEEAQGALERAGGEIDSIKRVHGERIRKIEGMMNAFEVAFEDVGQTARGQIERLERRVEGAAGLEEQVLRLREEKAGLQEQVMRLGEEKSRLEEHVESARGEASRGAEEKIRLGQDVMRLEEEVMAAKAALVEGVRVSEERHVEELQQQVMGLQQQVSGLRNDLGELEGKYRDAEGRAERLMEAEAKALEEVMRLQREVGVSEGRAAVAEERCEELVKETGQLRKEGEGIRAERDAILEERDAARDERDAILEERDAARDERDTLRSELDDRSKDAASEMDALRAELARSKDAASEMDALRAELARSKDAASEMDALRAELARSKDAASVMGSSSSSEMQAVVDERNKVLLDLAEALAELSSAASERDALREEAHNLTKQLSQLGDAVSERDAARCGIEQLRGERDAIASERDALVRQVAAVKRMQELGQETSPKWREAEDLKSAVSGMHAAVCGEDAGGGGDAPVAMCAKVVRAYELLKRKLDKAEKLLSNGAAVTRDDGGFLGLFSPSKQQQPQWGSQPDASMSRSSSVFDAVLGAFSSPSKPPQTPVGQRHSTSKKRVPSSVSSSRPVSGSRDAPYDGPQPMRLQMNGTSQGEGDEIEVHEESEVMRLKAELKKTQRQCFAAEARASGQHGESLRCQIGVKTLCEEVRNVSCELAGVMFTWEADRASADALKGRISELARELAASDSQRARLESACRVLQKGISEFVTSGGGAWAPVAGGFGPGGTSKTGGACGKLLAEVDEIRGGGDDVAAAAVASIRLLLSSGGGTTGSSGWACLNGVDTSGVARPSGGDTGGSLPGGMLSRGDMEMAEEVIEEKLKLAKGLQEMLYVRQSRWQEAIEHASLERTPAVGPPPGGVLVPDGSVAAAAATAVPVGAVAEVGGRDGTRVCVGGGAGAGGGAGRSAAEAAMEQQVKEALEEGKEHAMRLLEMAMGRLDKQKEEIEALKEKEEKYDEAVAMLEMQKREIESLRERAAPGEVHGGSGAFGGEFGGGLDGKMGENLAVERLREEVVKANEAREAAEVAKRGAEILLEQARGDVKRMRAEMESDSLEADMARGRRKALEREMSEQADEIRRLRGLLGGVGEGAGDRVSMLIEELEKSNAKVEELSSILVEQEEALEGERQSHVEAAQRLAHAESRLVARPGSTAAISVTSSPVKGGLVTTPQKQEQLQSGRSPGGDRVKQLMVELQGIEARRDEEVAALTEELERARLDIEHLRGERDALLAELEQARARVSDLERSERDADARVSGVVGDARARALSAEQAVKDAEARASAADLASSSAERRLAEASSELKDERQRCNKLSTEIERLRSMLHQAHKGAQGGEGELARVVSQLQEARRGAAESDEELGKVKAILRAAQEAWGHERSRLEGLTRQQHGTHKREMQDLMKSSEEKDSLLAESMEAVKRYQGRCKEMEELVRVTENDADRCRRKLQALESDVHRLEESRSSLLLEQEQTRKLVGRGSGSSVGAREHELMMREMLIACSSLRGSGGAKQIIGHGSQVTDQLYLGVDGRERGGTRVAGHGLHEAHLDLEGDGRRASSREEQEKGGSSAGDFESKLDKCRQQIRSLTADNRELFTRSAIAGHRHEVGPRQSKAGDSKPAAARELAARLAPLAASRSAAEAAEAAAQRTGTGGGIHHMMEQARAWAAEEVERKIAEAGAEGKKGSVLKK